MGLAVTRFRPADLRTACVRKARSVRGRFLFTALLVVPGCGSVPCMAFGPPTLCITPTPKSWDAEGIREAFSIAAQAGACICLPDPTDWWHAQRKAYAASKQHQVAQWQQFLLRQHSLDVFIQIDPFRPHRWSRNATPALLRGASFGKPAIREAFIADALERVTLYKPKYVCLGMEINTYYEEHPDDFDNFVSLFKETRRKIKKIHPDVVVFVSFQYEQLQGLHLGKSVVASREPRWELIERFEPDQDAVGISSYPLASWSPPRYGPPGELPKDYYTRLRKYTSKPIIFAELGWPSDPAFGGTPEAQAEFLTRFPSLIQGLDVRLVNWNFLFDVKGYGPVFESMGLFDSAGKPKPAWASWRNVSRSPGTSDQPKVNP